MLYWLHSRWINNCVGIGTMKPFVLFLVYTFFYCLLAIVLCASFFVHELSIEVEVPWKLFTTAIVALLGLFFCVFTASMFVDIMTVIRSGTTCLCLHSVSFLAIDTLKGVSYHSDFATGLQCVWGECLTNREVFGGKGSFSPDWLIPTKPVYIDRDDIYGYRRECLDAVVIGDRGSDWVS